MNRIDRVNQQMKREIGNILLREMSDPRLKFVSITHVETSKDLRSARVFFSVLGDSGSAKEAEHGLDNAKGYVRKLVGQKLTLRYTPELHFHHDKSIEFSARIDETIMELKNERNEDNPEDQ